LQIQDTKFQLTKYHKLNYHSNKFTIRTECLNTKKGTERKSHTEVGLPVYLLPSQEHDYHQQKERKSQEHPSNNKKPS